MILLLLRRRIRKLPPRLILRSRSGRSRVRKGMAKETPAAMDFAQNRERDLDRAVAIVVIVLDLMGLSPAVGTAAFSFAVEADLEGFV